MRKIAKNPITLKWVLCCVSY